MTRDELTTKTLDILLHTFESVASDENAINQFIIADLKEMAENCCAYIASASCDDKADPLDVYFQVDYGNSGCFTHTENFGEELINLWADLGQDGDKKEQHRAVVKALRELADKRESFIQD